MHHPVADDLGVFQAGDHLDEALLLGPLEPRLEPHQAPHPPRLVLLAELDHGEGLLPRAGVHEPHGLHGAKEQGLVAPPGELLHGDAGLKELQLLPVVGVWRWASRRAWWKRRYSSSVMGQLR